MERTRAYVTEQQQLISYSEELSEHPMFQRLAVDRSYVAKTQGRKDIDLRL